jgi:hypothetical protein
MDGVEVITMDGVIIVAGAIVTGSRVIVLKEAASVWRLFHLSRTQKPPRFPSTACAVALRLSRGLLRRAVLERGPSLLATGRTAFIE